MAIGLFHSTGIAGVSSNAGSLVGILGAPTRRARGLHDALISVRGTAPAEVVERRELRKRLRRNAEVESEFGNAVGRARVKGASRLASEAAKSGLILHGRHLQTEATCRG